jgi:hypothetical protein
MIPWNGNSRTGLKTQMVMLANAAAEKDEKDMRISGIREIK